MLLKYEVKESYFGGFCPLKWGLFFALVCWLRIFNRSFGKHAAVIFHTIYLKKKKLVKLNIKVVAGYDLKHC